METKLTRNIFIFIFLYFTFSVFCNEIDAGFNPNFILQNKSSYVAVNNDKPFILNYTSVGMINFSTPKNLNSDDNGGWINDIRRLEIIKGFSIALAAVSFVVGTPLTAVGVAGFVFIINSFIFTFVAVLGLIMGASVIAVGILACVMVYYVINRIKELSAPEFGEKRYIPQIEFRFKLG